MQMRWKRWSNVGKALLVSLLLYGAGCSRNVTSEPAKWAYLCPQYRTRVPVFLKPSRDVGAYEVACAAASYSGVPVSAEDYMENPGSWWCSEAYCAYWGGARQCQTPVSIHDVVPKGTVVRVVRITEKRDALFGRYCTVWGDFGDGKQVCISDLFKDVLDSYPQPKPKLEYLEPVRSHGLSEGSQLAVGH